MEFDPSTTTTTQDSAWAGAGQAQRTVWVEAPARLHLGFLDPAGSLGRPFGSLGLTVSAPVTRLGITAASGAVNQVSAGAPQVPAEDLQRAERHLAELQRRSGRPQPLALQLDCPRCRRALQRGFDIVRSGRYLTWRCPERHGRFSAFSSFMIEKGFVRLLTKPEVDDIARRVAVIHCTSCGAPVDLRKDHACPHCRSAFSLIDPQAVQRALDGYAGAAQPAAPNLPDVADALMAIESERLKAERERQTHHRNWFSRPAEPSGDLLAAGVEMVWKMLR